MGYANQTAVDFQHGKAYAGSVNKQKPYSINSKVNTSLDIIPYGIGVVADGVNGVKLVTGSEADLSTYVGMAIRDYGHVTVKADVDTYSQGQNVGVCTMGEVDCLVIGDVAFGDDVFLRIGSTGRGLYCNAVGTGVTASLQIPGAKFIESGKSETVVKATFNLG